MQPPDCAPSSSILPRDSDLFRRLHRAATELRCVFFAGLPGVGKSLLLQQCSLIAQEVGRRVHLLQWDVARGPFETTEILGRYPEIDGVTHAVIRKAAGLWARGAVGAWDRDHADPRDVLIGEVPLIGSRLIELVQQRSDGVEGLLAGEGTVFLIPVPSREVRRAIEEARAREMASPAHERERANALPSLVQAFWEEIVQVARALGVEEAPSPDQGEAPTLDSSPGQEAPTPGRCAARLSASPTSSPARGGGETGASGALDQRTAGGFDPDLYARVYERLLRHRRIERLDVTAVLPVQASVYEGITVASELAPSAEEVVRIIQEVGARPQDEVEREVADWLRV